ncbi:alpha-hydroxy acid oxidase [Pigmentiphaga sp.]|uniref:alpha-hydroxy acid oxidase n=1 Tax=Pigmentiphaga sp. TaxID=1977564 RepID=UPI00128E054A|nr:alpha-hydroxy acid oxidase [Pigmentiphaga sp.]MPS27768.1 alpha-hydroxy-acid oxidizing protein [Alcaligenaceae bacterium SAGV5]MPS50878.1 alpha-hydroxy-acid oxidizing protein [Alcaligenaceae bacterium SAGV3]MPT59572.1 alpha-hydroxy-acid oxidizing protein [Alcaligenaceae bacterium]
MGLFDRGIGRAQSIDDLRAAARRRLPRLVFDFFDGGAESEATLADNRQAFERVRLLPRALVDVSQVSTRCTVLGAPADYPLAIAPTGGVGYGRHGGDLAIARAAARHGIPYTLSTSATASIEEVAREAPGRLWFQAYVLKNQDFFHALIERARAADYEALVITVDLPVGGKRERDVRNGFRTPFRLTTRSFGDVAAHPRWALALLRHGMPVNKNLIGLQRDVTSVAGLASAVGRNYDPSFDWDRLAQVRDRWPRKLIVKGILRPDDADRVVRLGADAVVVSNHGGRQLDGACATLDALPGVVDAVAGRIPVWLDGGVRRGVDILKARALGAEGVLVGRATLYGAVAGGEPGAHRALQILTEELVRAMKLCGAPGIEDIDETLLARPPRQATHEGRTCAG